MFAPTWPNACRLSLYGLVALIAAASNAHAEDGFTPMFNGKDFSGWVRTNTPEDTWQYQDGMVVCSGKPIGEIRTTKMYQNFVMELEWRHMKPKGNAGIFVWADDITARGVPFHRGVEVQVLENAYGNSRGHTTHGDIFPIHGAKMTPINGRGGSRAFPTENRSRPSPQWNHYRIECNAGEISLAVNGKVVTRGKQASPSKGYICIESEGGVVHYRNAKIKELPATPIDDADVATANRGFVSLYSGLDLRGWQASDETCWQAQDWVLAHRPTNVAQGQGSHRLTATGAEVTTVQAELLFDIRWDGDASFDVSLGDSTVEFTPATKGMRRGWNRVVLTASAGEPVAIQVNGEVVSTKAKATKGALTMQAAGKLSLANVYHRPLD